MLYFREKKSKHIFSSLLLGWGSIPLESLSFGISAFHNVFHPFILFIGHQSLSKLHCFVVVHEYASFLLP